MGFPAIIAETGVGAGVLIAAGAPLRDRRGGLRCGEAGPNPGVFGYHEIFHVLVIAAAAAHFAAVALFALPAA